MTEDDGVPAPEWYDDNVVPLREYERQAGLVPDDEIRIPANETSPIQATPFFWRPEAELPPRKWLYGRHLLRKFLSVDVAAGGVGKSSLKIGEALAMASGRDLYSQNLHEGALRVWIYNLEDPAEETERRIHATAKRFRLRPEDLGDRLYVDSGRDQPCVIATETPNGAMIARPVVEAIIEQLMERRIDVLSIDPFVSSHAISENDNMAIDMVAKEWARIADIANCSINLVHHVRKQNGTEANADSARGASALIGAARSVMVFNRMVKEEADKLGVAEDEMRFYFRVDNDKANLAPSGTTTWYRMNNVHGVPRTYLRASAPRT
jgi:RecA-family ATPase